MSSSRLKEKRRLTISDRLTHFKKWGITTSIGDDYISVEGDRQNRKKREANTLAAQETNTSTQ